MRFEFVPAESLHAPWPRVKEGLERVREVSPERWLPEDVFAHLRIKAAQLFLGYDGDVYRGFFITESKKDNFTNEPYLQVWVLYGEPTEGEHCANVAAFVDETIDFIDGIAKRTGALWIAMDGREGWRRFLKGYFEPVKVKYERRINHGR